MKKLIFLILIFFYCSGFTLINHEEPSGNTSIKACLKEFYSKGIAGNPVFSVSDFNAVPITGPLWFRGFRQLPSNQKRLASYQLFGFGDGYSVGDILTLTGGVFTSAATFRVTKIGGGVSPTGATELLILSSGSYTTIPTGTTHILSGGGGSDSRLWKLQFLGNSGGVSGAIETIGIVGYTVSLKRPPVQENEVRFTCTTDIVYFSEDGLTGDHHIKSFTIPPFTIPALE